MLVAIDRLAPEHPYPAALHDALAAADCVVLCAPHTPETEGMIGAGEFRAMKRGVTFVNIARGALVDDIINTVAITAIQAQTL